MIAMWENLFRSRDVSDEIRELLRNTYLFKDLSRGELKLLQDLVHTRFFKAGEAIFRQADVGVGVYIIKQGVVDIRIEDTEKKEPESMPVTRLRTGDFWGALFVEDNSKRGASAYAYEEATLLGFFRPDLQEIMQRNPTSEPRSSTGFRRSSGVDSK